MDNKVEQCPKCGNYVEGKIMYSADEKVTRAVASKGVSWVYGAIFGAIFGSFLFPIGTIIGFVLGAIVSSTIGKGTAEAVGNEIFSDADFKFTCPKCGHSWVKHLVKGTDYTTTKALQNEKNKIISLLKSRKQGHAFLAILCGIIAAPTLWYCIENDFKVNFRTVKTWLGSYDTYDYNFTWLFLAIICFFTILGFLSNLVEFFEDSPQIEDLKKMSIEDFRGSEIRYKYKQD